MKKLNYLLAVLLAVTLFVGCKKKEDDATPEEISVTQKQNALLMEPTATWCGPCGTYGHPATDGVMTDNKDVVGIYAHLKVPASDLGSQVGQDLAVIVGAANAAGTSYSIPKISVGDNVTGAFTDINYTKGILNGWINTLVANVSKANTKIEASIDGSNLNIKTHTKFFEAGVADNQYKIAIIITEDNISNRQNQSTGIYKTIIHNHIARVAASASASGDNLHDLAATPTAGKVIDKNFTVALDAKWKKSDLTVVAIIWKQVGTKLSFVNVDKLDLD